MKNNTFKYLILLGKIIIAVILISACTDSSQENELKSTIWNEVESFKFNPEGGYDTNVFTGEQITHIITPQGDTVKTGVRIPIRGRNINPDSINKPQVIELKGEPIQTNAHPNIHFIQNKLKSFPFNLDELPKIPFNSPSSNERISFVLNTLGDTILTGVPFEPKGRVELAKTSKPILSSSPLFKENAIYDIQSWGKDEGISHPFIRSIFEDTHGYLWITSAGGGFNRFDGRHITHFSNKEGLAGQAYIVKEDSKGNLWFGMYGGLARYDGTNITHFSEKDMIGVTTMFIFEDSKGNLWFGSINGGVSKFDGENFTHFTENEGLKGKTVMCIEEDIAGNLWFITQEGISVFDGSSFTYFSGINSFTNSRVIKKDNNGNMWIGTLGNGLWKYDGKVLTQYTTANGLLDNSIYTITIDGKSNLWLGTDKGLCYFEQSKEIEKYFVHYTESEGLPVKFVTSIIESKNGDIWFSTWGGGISRLKRSSFWQFPILDKIPRQTVQAITEDKAGNIWFAIFGNGLRRYDGTTITQFDKENGLPLSTIKALITDTNGNLWFGTSEQGVCRFDGKQLVCYDKNSGLAENYVEGLIQDIHENIWILGEKTLVRFDGEGFTHFTQNEGMYFGNASGIIDDSVGNIWIATYGTGLICLQDTSFTRFAEKEGLISKKNYIVSKDRIGNIWVGNTDYGASRISNHSIEHFSVSEVAMDNTISSFVEDNMGNHWMGSNYGLHLMKFDRTIQGTDENSLSTIVNIKSYRKPEGLKDLFITANAMLHDSKNRMWFGAAYGPIMLDLNTFYAKKGQPQIFLRNIVINGNFKDFRSNEENQELIYTYNGVIPYENIPINLQLPYDHNRLTFHFSVQYEQPQHKILYSYRMDGVDESWTAPNPDPKAEYRNLPHGTHTFQVKAIGESLEETDVLEYQFTILPPWWHTWWAYLIYVFVFLLGLFTFSKWREKRLRIEKEKLEHIVNVRTTELKESLENLKATQSQLVQQEKLASLGQLTAGIAHEIKNPLNFVNNFSEVSLELIDELRSELDQVKTHNIASPLASQQTDLSNIDEAESILKDIESNLRKIHEHGSRANSIVSSMLQHSRGGTGKKEPEDLNALVKEYVNLCFHGMRAGKNPINVSISLDLDPKIHEVSLIHEDFTRVIINLCNNAFDAMRQKKLLNPEDYLPKLSVRTKSERDCIVIEVEDNGPGIPDDIKDKILQPFFTTKKGTEGTGLGLSITHDIVKAHGGEFRLESKTGDKTVFIIKIPIV